MLTILNHPLLDVKMTSLRDKTTPPHSFRRILHEVASLMSAAVFSHLTTQTISVETPLEHTQGFSLPEPLPCLVSILRAGNGLTDAFSAILPEIPIGHLGLQRNPDTHQAEAYYEKLPNRIAERQIILVDPMLATGGSAIMAADRLKAHGAHDILFACLVASPEGLSALQEAHNDIPIIAAAVDRELDDNFYILPGLGDAGDRIYNTV